MREHSICQRVYYVLDGIKGQTCQLGFKIPQFYVLDYNSTDQS